MSVSDEAMRRYKRQIAVYRDRTASALIAAWDRLDDIDEDNITTYTKAVTAPLAGAKTAAVALSAAFFAMALNIRPVGIRARDVPVEADLRQPFTATWHALSMGRSFEQALLVGRSTSQAVGFDFVQSSARRTGDAVAEASGKTVRWRRVPGPTSCDWCRTIAGRGYRSAESADFGHARCDCDAVPI